jgi:hypothetical protein
MDNIFRNVLATLRQHLNLGIVGFTPPFVHSPLKSYLSQLSAGTFIQLLLVC